MQNREVLDDTVRSHYHTLYERQKLRGKSPDTRRLYGIALDQFDRSLGRPALISDLNDDAVGDVMQWIVDRGGSNGTANKFRNHMLALWRFLCRKGIVDRWPDVPAFRDPERTPVAWTREQLQALWIALGELPGHVGDVPAAWWWRALHSVLWDTAERISAVMSLRWEDVDLSTGWVRVRAEYRKGGHADKTSRLHPETVEHLRRIQQPDGPVFSWPYCEAYLWIKYRRILKFAGLPYGRDRGFHCLRRTAASYFKAAGGNPSDLLGHSSPTVTRRYIDPRIDTPPQAADLLFRPAG